MTNGKFKHTDEERKMVFETVALLERDRIRRVKFCSEVNTLFVSNPKVTDYRIKRLAQICELYS